MSQGQTPSPARDGLCNLASACSLCGVVRLRLLLVETEAGNRAKARSAVQPHLGIAAAAAVWSFVFAVFHCLWAAGWYVGLDPVQARAAFARPTFLAYDLVVALMCIIAVPLSLALAMPWGRQVPRRLLLWLAWAGTTLLMLRAVASLGQAGYELITGRFTLDRMGVWEPWFWVGAGLFASNLWLYRRQVRGAAA